jgi:hypothetical protein
LGHIPKLTKKQIIILHVKPKPIQFLYILRKLLSLNIEFGINNERQDCKIGTGCREVSGMRESKWRR